MEYDEIENNIEWYRQRIEWRNEQSEGFLGTKHVLTPDEDTPPHLLDAYHLLMTARGPLGVEYAQEALHQEGGKYFINFFSEEGADYDGSHEVMDDFELFCGEYE